MDNINKNIETTLGEMENVRIDPAQVKGWGIDADAENDPTYPMRIRENETEKSYSWERPTQQPVSVEVLHSNERPNVAAAFGTAVPPAGLSGMIRRKAFKFSENSYGHWLPLMLADRVGIVEGIVEDFSRGHVPNILGERGWNAEWKYNRANLITKVLISAAVAGVAVALVRRRKSDDFEGVE